MCFISSSDLQDKQKVIPLVPLTPGGFQQWKKQASRSWIKWLEGSGFMASPGQFCGVPGADGSPELWLVGTEDTGYLYRLSSVASGLPQGIYRLDCDWLRKERLQASLGWGLASYRFDRYKADNKQRPVLVLETDVDSEVRSLLAAQRLVRDLVNTPTEHMGPSDLADAVTREAGGGSAWNCRMASASADLLEKSVDLNPQDRGLLFECGGAGKHLACGRTGRNRKFAHFLDVA